MDDDPERADVEQIARDLSATDDELLEILSAEQPWAALVDWMSASRD